MSKNVKDRAIRLIAINKVKDRDLLWDAAENSQFFDVRSFAYERLGENNKSIAEIVINTKKNPDVDEIFEKIADEETLEWIAIEADDKRYRNEAVDRIESAEILEDLVFKAKDNSIKRTAINKENFKDEEILKKIAIDQKDEDIKIAAINKIEDEEKLAEIAQCEDNAKIRSLLFEKIDNGDILKEIILKSDKPDVQPGFGPKSG